MHLRKVSFITVAFSSPEKLKKTKRNIFFQHPLERKKVRKKERMKKEKGDQRKELKKRRGRQRGEKQEANGEEESKIKKEIK